MALPSIVPLRDDDVPAAAAAMARAFQDDPLQTYVFPDPVERAARSPAHFLPMLRYGLLFGEVWTTDGCGRSAEISRQSLVVSDQSQSSVGSLSPESSVCSDCLTAD